MQKQPTAIAPPSATSNTGPVLSELAERAARHHGQSIESWLACADVLLEARGLAGHGEWLPFLEHAGIKKWTAQRMLRIAGFGLKRCTVHHLGGIGATIECLAANPEGVGALVVLLGHADDLREQIAVREANLSPEERVRLDEALADLREIRRLKRELNGWQSKHAVAQRERNRLRREDRRRDDEIYKLNSKKAFLAATGGA